MSVFSSPADVLDHPHSAGASPPYATLPFPALSSASTTSSSDSNPPSPESEPFLVHRSDARMKRRRQHPGPAGSYPLQRGSACLQCRKRKMKCDAAKPACAQCVKAHRADACDYDDGKSRSRTQVLQDKIATLEARLQDIQHAPPPTVAVTYAPEPSIVEFPTFDVPPLPAFQGEWFAPPPEALVPAAPEFNFPPLAAEEEPWAVLQNAGAWWDRDEPPARVRSLLIALFAPHAAQCGLPESALARTEASPALRNACYALAAHFNPALLAPRLEALFVARAAGALDDALVDAPLQAVQASCLLAVHCFAKGNMLRGVFHAGAAARLAVGLGLHQLPPVNAPSRPGSPVSAGAGVLPPPIDASDTVERVQTWWQVFTLDRQWAAATGLPAALPAEGIYSAHPGFKILTELPSPADSSIRLETPLTPAELAALSTAALHAKAAALFERAASLSAAYAYSLSAVVSVPPSPDEDIVKRASTPPPELQRFWADFRQTDLALSALAAALPPLTFSPPDPARVMLHALVHAASVRLHAHFASAAQDPTSHARCVREARQAASCVRTLQEGRGDFALLDPVVGACWAAVADALARLGACEAEVGVLLGGLRALGRVVPLASFQADKVEQARGHPPW